LSLSLSRALEYCFLDWLCYHLLLTILFKGIFMKSFLFSLVLVFPLQAMNVESGDVNSSKPTKLPSLSDQRSINANFPTATEEQKAKAAMELSVAGFQRLDKQKRSGGYNPAPSQGTLPKKYKK
jgi:hypothetical protein